MPLLRIDDIDGQARLGIWHMTETVGEMPKPSRADLSDTYAERRLLEKLTIYALLHAMTGKNDLVIRHEPSDKPELNGYEISISHTRGWAALMLSSSTPVAVDIEYYADRVSKVADRFIRPDEDGSTLNHQLINWSAKETTYKFFSEEDLLYEEMRLRPFSPMDAGKVIVDDLKYPKTLEISYLLNSDYVLTWAL